MKVTTAKSAGFCFGVQRAVEKVYQEIVSGEKPIYTYGPIIHNEEVIHDLEEKGVQILETPDDIQNVKTGTIIIRSHGVSKQIRQIMDQSGLRVIDATCLFVLKIHRYVEEYSKKGYYIIIIGNPGHPEVEGICGWADPGRASVISSKEEIAALNLPLSEKLCIVSQTTFNLNKFQELVEIIAEKGYDRIVLNTICSATEQRQKEARALSEQVDGMIVVGGKHSSNTRKLYEICKEKCDNTYFIQTKDDLKHIKFPRFDYVGITAGASTPNKIIEEVQKYVRNEL